MSEPELLNTTTLRDGRTLSYARFGDPQGVPVLYFHGFPGCRLEPQVGHEDALKAGVRLLAVDRPGFGRSSPKPGRGLLDWPDDVVELADSLGLARFAVMGVSGGGPYTAVCAYRIPERLTKAAIVCGVGPFDVPGATEGMMRTNRMLFGAARYLSPVVRLMMASMKRSLLRDPAKAFAQMAARLPEPDRLAMQRPEVRETFPEGMRESLNQGTAAAVQEAKIYAKPWGFRLEDITLPVELFQGELDVNVPVGMGRYQASAIPNCRAHFYPEEGHLSLALNRMGEVLASLT